MRFTLLSLAAVVLPLSIANPLNVTKIKARTTPDEDRRNALFAHNWMRGFVGVPLLEWDSGLQREAQAEADYMAAIDELERGSLINRGSNVAYMYPQTDHDLHRAVGLWLDGSGSYHGEIIPYGDFAAYGSYTQCVWRGTKRVGMGAARSATGFVYVSAHYNPPGNWDGERPY